MNNLNKDSLSDISGVVLDELDNVCDIPFCPICNELEKNKGSQNIKICDSCKSKLLE